jgi:hypothetical protein
MPQLAIVSPATEPATSAEAADLNIHRAAIEQDISIMLSPDISMVV